MDRPTLANIRAKLFRPTELKFDKDLKIEVGNDNTLPIKRDVTKQYCRSFFKTNIKVAVTQNVCRVAYIQQSCVKKEIFRSLKSGNNARIIKDGSATKAIWK